MIDFKEKEQYSMDDLVQIVAMLRDPENGCPWDKQQTHQSIRQNMIEETYEVIEAIDLEDTALLREELGDVLLQVVFHSQMEAEKSSFNFDAVCDEVSKKLVYRHPHVFGQLKADTADGALEAWEKMKNQEKGRDTAADRLDSIPASLPALMRAAKAQKRAAAYGFKPQNAEETLQMLSKKVSKLNENPDNAKQAVGQVLFAAVATARSMGVEPEEALSKATEMFCQRVKQCEADAEKDGKLLEDLDRQDLSEYWKRTCPF